MIPIERNDVVRLLDEGAQLVEVLPRKEYEAEHIAGAVSIPLRDLEKEIASLDRDRPVIVYCWDSACDLSPRAAHRLDSLGFTDVYDYVDGKLDWMSAGMPIEGARSGDRAGDLAKEIPTCRLADTIGDVRSRRGAQDSGVAVVDGDGVVLGLVRPDDLDGDPSRSAEDAMRPGPSTYRPFVPAHELLHEMTDRDAQRVLVTTSDGRLVGFVDRADLEG